MPLVPPWVPQPGEKDQPANGGGAGGDTAPAARFGNARRGLGEFARSADSSALRRGLSHYASRGLGGAGGAARRLGGAAVRSVALFNALGGLSAGTLDPTKLGFDTASLEGRSAREIIDRVARFVSPSDGSQDAESSQRAVNAALSDLLEQDPEVDVSSLTREQIDWVLERHIVHEIVQRIELDVGKSIVQKAPSPGAAIERMKEMREYVEESVSAAFRENRQTNAPVDSSSTARLSSSVIRDTFTVFEEYVE